VVAVALFPVQEPKHTDEHRILLSNVPWPAYVAFRDSLHSRGVRMTYLKGSLEIMRSSRQHEVGTTQIARLLELFCLERDIPLYGYGSTTLRKEEEERGLDPDECYCRDRDAEVPDLALEVIVTNPLLDKLEVYRGLGVGEVWIYKDHRVEVRVLRADRYVRAERSELFPEVDLEAIARYAALSDQHAALRSFRDELRASVKG
jgi:Uma2 family endonuclease